MPESSARLTVHEFGRHGEPFNAEPPIGSLVSHFITPTPDLFHRNHDDIVYVPKTSATYDEWKLSFQVDADVAEERGWKAWQGRETITLPLSDLIDGKNSCSGLQHLAATATLECAGNRREEIAKGGEGEPAEGIQWGPGVIGNINWSGPLIRSLLMLHAIPDPYSHHPRLSSLRPTEEAIQRDCAPWAKGLHLHILSVQPTSESERPEGQCYGASIPLATAMHPNQNCILAHQHNGKMLDEAHGFPLRAVTPGHLGARWVKWVCGVRISKRENDAPSMQLDYKLLSPPKGLSEQERKQWKAKITGKGQDHDFRKAELEKTEPMQRLGVGSAVDRPHEGDTLHGTTVDVSGYAVGQDGSPVSLVECILLKEEQGSENATALRDRAEKEGASRWVRANVNADSSQSAQPEDSGDALSWAWSLWKVQVPLPQADLEKEATYAMIVRATTASGVQQEKESPWNVRGFQTRSWPVVRGLKLAT